MNYRVVLSGVVVVAIVSLGGLGKAFGLDGAVPDFGDFRVSKPFKSEEGVVSEVVARRFVDNVQNKGPLILGSQYFVDVVNRRYDLANGKKYRFANSNYITAAVIVSQAMRKLSDEIASSDEDHDSSSIQKKWEVEKNRVLGELKETEVLVDQAIEVWAKFLDKWLTDARDRAGTNFIAAFKEAPFEILSAVIKKRNQQEIDAKSGLAPSSGSSANSDVARSSTGSPVHERAMNHIVHHYERKISRAERIRGRR